MCHLFELSLTNDVNTFLLHLFKKSDFSEKNLEIEEIFRLRKNFRPWLRSQELARPYSYACRTWRTSLWWKRRKCASFEFSSINNEQCVFLFKLLSFRSSWEQNSISYFSSIHELQIRYSDCMSAMRTPETLLTKSISARGAAEICRGVTYSLHCKRFVEVTYILAANARHCCRLCFPLRGYPMRWNGTHRESTTRQSVIEMRYALG